MASSEIKNIQKKVLDMELLILNLKHFDNVGNAATCHKILILFNQIRDLLQEFECPVINCNDKNIDFKEIQRLINLLKTKLIDVNKIPYILGKLESARNNLPWTLTFEDVIND